MTETQHSKNNLWTKSKNCFSKDYLCFEGPSLGESGSICMPCESSLLAELDVIVNKSLKSIPVPSFA